MYYLKSRTHPQEPMAFERISEAIGKAKAISMPYEEWDILDEEGSRVAGFISGDNNQRLLIESVFVYPY